MPLGPVLEGFMWFFWDSFKWILFLMDHFHFRVENVCGQPWVPAAILLQPDTASSGDKAFLDYPSCGLIQNAPFLFSELRLDSGDFVAPCGWEMLPSGFTSELFQDGLIKYFYTRQYPSWSEFLLISLSFWETYSI